MSAIIYFNFEGNPAAFRRSKVSPLGESVHDKAEAWLKHPDRERYTRPTRLLVGYEWSGEIAELYEVAVTERTVVEVGPTPEFEAAVGRAS